MTKMPSVRVSMRTLPGKLPPDPLMVLLPLDGDSLSIRRHIQLFDCRTDHSCACMERIFLLIGKNRRKSRQHTCPLVLLPQVQLHWVRLNPQTRLHASVLCPPRLGFHKYSLHERICLFYGPVKSGHSGLDLVSLDRVDKIYADDH